MAVTLNERMELVERRNAELEAKVAKFENRLRDHKLFCKYVAEYLLHKFGFNIWLRLEMVKSAADFQYSDSEDGSLYPKDMPSLMPVRNGAVKPKATRKSRQKPPTPGAGAATTAEKTTPATTPAGKTPTPTPTPPVIPHNNPPAKPSRPAAPQPPSNPIIQCQPDTQEQPQQFPTKSSSTVALKRKSNPVEKNNLDKSILKRLMLAPTIPPNQGSDKSWDTEEEVPEEVENPAAPTTTTTVYVLETEDEEDVEAARTELSSSGVLSRIISVQEYKDAAGLNGSMEEDGGEMEIISGDVLPPNNDMELPMDPFTYTVKTDTDDDGTEVVLSTTGDVGETEVPAAGEGFRRVFITTTDKSVVEIIHEDYNDPNIDIKYETALEEQEEEEVTVVGMKEAELKDEAPPSPKYILVAPPPPQTSSKPRYIPFFDISWLYQMKQYQQNVMPYKLLAKRDEYRQWFEYLPNEKPEESRYRCRLCYRYLQKFGIPRSYWGPVESEKGQLKRTESDNRNVLNSHAKKKSHIEVILKLQTEGNPDLGFIDKLDRTKRKRLLEELS